MSPGAVSLAGQPVVDVRVGRTLQGVLDDERADDHLPHLAAAVVADEGALVDDHRAPGLRDLPDRARQL